MKNRRNQEDGCESRQLIRGNGVDINNAHTMDPWGTP